MYDVNIKIIVHASKGIIKASITLLKQLYYFDMYYFIIHQFYTDMHDKASVECFIYNIPEIRQEIYQLVRNTRAILLPFFICYYMSKIY